MAETLVDEMKITTQICNVISNDKHVNRGMAIKLGQWPWKGKTANQGFILSHGSTAHDWGKRRRHECGEIWHVSRMKTNKKINKNKTKIESIESINRGQEKFPRRYEVFFSLF